MVEYSHDKVLEVWAAGRTFRWHNHKNSSLRSSQDRTDGHGARVAMLFSQFYPEATKEEILYAISHDFAEDYFGDISARAKNASPSLKEELNRLEHIRLGELGLNTVISEDVRDLITVCDWIDAYLWAQHICPTIVEDERWKEELEKRVTFTREKALSLYRQEPLGRTPLSIAFERAYLFVATFQDVIE